jgi:myosin heavy subunit
LQKESEEELPDPPFSKKDKRTASYSLERQWSIDRDLLETFFTSLCQQVLQQVDAFPQKKASLLALAEQKIKTCLQALIARYHPDKAKESEKDFLQNNILQHPLFTSSGEALYLVIRTYHPLNFAAALDRLIQGMRGILQDYKRMSEINEQTIQDTIEVSRSMSEVAEDYREIQQTLTNSIQALKRTDPIIETSIQLAKQTQKDAQAIASDMHEANEKMDEILQSYADVIQSQKEERKKLAKCREGIEQLGIGIQEYAQQGAEQFADLNKSLEETQKCQQQQWGMLREILAANQTESLLEGDTMTVPTIEEGSLFIDSLLREQESFAEETLSSHQEILFP